MEKKMGQLLGGSVEIMVHYGSASCRFSSFLSFFGAEEINAVCCLGWCILNIHGTWTQDK